MGGRREVTSNEVIFFSSTENLTDRSQSGAVLAFYALFYNVLTACVVEIVSKKIYFSLGLINWVWLNQKREWFMIKKIAILALAVSAAFSNALAQSSCTVNISTNNLEFTGKQVKPTIKKVVCGNDEYSEGDFAKVVYGKNINAGTDAGSVTITLINGDVATKTFDIEPKGVHITVDDVEKELGGETPDLTWTIAEDSELDVLDADTLANFLVALQKELKLVVASGEEQVGTKFKVSKDPSVNLTELFPNYDFLVDPGSLLITKTKIIIIVESTAKVYGEKDPEKFNYEVRGNIVPADYAKLGEIELVRASGEDAGTYTIPVSIDGVE